MAEKTYPEYKKVEQSINVSPTAMHGSFGAGPKTVSVEGGSVVVTKRRAPSGAFIVARGVRIRRAGTPKGNYSEYKATLSAAVEEIKTEIRDQHKMTRTEVQATRQDILAAVKASPVESVKLISEFGILFLLFSLAVRFLLNIELVNTAFALLMLFALALYWLMATAKQRTRKKEQTQA